jgi:EH_Signature domain
MDDLDDLAQRLQRLSETALLDLRIVDDPLPWLPDVVAKILGRALSDVGPRPVSGERIAEAIAEVRRGASNLSPRILRFAVHGSCSRCDPDNYFLLGDQLALERLLAACERELRNDHRRFRRLYGGLLSSYFAAERNAAWFVSEGVDEGFRRLRQFLEQHRDIVVTQSPRTNWADALAQHPPLLSEAPGSSFAAGWINGGDAVLSTVLDQLRLGGASWLACDVTRSALGHIARAEESEFRALIPRFLAAAVEPRFLSIRDEIYAGLLIRYSKCKQTAAHPDLRDAVIGAWRAPWMAKNQAAWGRVPHDVRTMVEGWLKREFMRQFFDVLSDDRHQDRRRFEFWLLHIDRMDAVYFALGSDADKRQDVDWKRLKASLEGRSLAYSGSRSTHAFIMYIDDKAVVEFSQTGNAAYFYQKDDLLISAERHSAATSWLKRQPPGRQMNHQDSGTATWEEKFRRALGVYTTADTPRRPADARRSELAPTAPRIDHIIGYARANGIGVEDKRAQGGNLWLLADQSNPALNERLTAWGFAPKSGRGWWRAD